MKLEAAMRLIEHYRDVNVQALLKRKLEDEDDERQRHAEDVTLWEHKRRLEDEDWERESSCNNEDG